MKHCVRIERPDPDELARLFFAVGWGRVVSCFVTALGCSVPLHYLREARVRRSHRALSAFSDRVMSTMLGELVAHPEHHRQGVGAEMLRAVEVSYPNVPIYSKA